MNTILTDDELKAECRVGFGIDPILDGNLIKFGRAIEAAVLAKLARQEPALLVRCELPQHKGQWMAEDGRRFLLSDPAPQHADRQRVPANKANNEFNRVIQHAITLGSEAASFLRCWNEGNWDGCREFDFEPALPYEIEEQADRQRVPEGWKLVPVDPTKEMVDAAVIAYERTKDGTIAGAYRAMLAAAPEAPAQAEQVPKAWMHEEDPYRVISDVQKQQAIRDGGASASSVRPYSIALVAPEAPAQAPIDMVLLCPACGTQHIDAPEECPDSPGRCECRGPHWKNPPHRSHLCHGCGHIRRPADVPTNGVPAIKTKGKADSPVARSTAQPTQAEAPAQADQMTQQERDILNGLREIKEMKAAQASAVDERAAFLEWQQSAGCSLDAVLAEDVAWESWQARAALAQKGGK